MDYPKTPHNDKRSTKLTLEQIKQLRIDYKKYHNYRLVGRIYHVSHTIIRYWVNESVRKENSVRSREYHRSRCNDPEFKKYRSKIQSKNDKLRRKIFPQIIEWEKENGKIYRSNHKEERRKKEKEWVQNNKEWVNKRSRIWYHKNK